MKKIAIIGGGISGSYFANLLNNELLKQILSLNKNFFLPGETEAT